MRDKSPAPSPRFCPPDPDARGSDLLDVDNEYVGAFAEWLAQITLPGAPTVPILDVPDRHDGIGCVPLIRRPVHSATYRSEEEILAAVPAGMMRPARGEAPLRREGRPRWEMEGAYWRDVAGESEVQVAERIDATVSEDSWRGREPRSRTAERWIVNGRRTLAGLHAWPWCMENDGRLTPRWWLDDRYLGALRRWHFAAFEDGLNGLLRPAQYLAGDRSIERWKARNRDLAREIYRAQFEAFCQPADRNEPPRADDPLAPLRRASGRRPSH